MNNNLGATPNQPSQISNQISNTVKNTTEYVGDKMESLGKAYTDIRTNVSNNLVDFSNKTSNTVDVSKEFLISNTIVAKVAFVLLILLLFLFFLYLGINMIQFIVNPSHNPYLVKGMISGNSGITINQDPTQQNSVTVLRSNNKKTGLEFTWSVWLYISDLNSSTKICQNVFNKGNPQYDSNTGLGINNGPGLYILPGAINNNENLNLNIGGLRVIMDLTGTDPATNNPYTKTDINNIPLKKWVNIIIRMENTMMDIYVNGVISNRTILPFVPKQNYYDVQICKNNGFSGNLSNLRYYDSALNIIQINNIVFWGPNLSANNNISTTKGGFEYLSSSWYTGIFS
jgi:hypothetical protein